MVMEKKSQYFEEIRMLRRQIAELEKYKEENQDILAKLKESEKHYRILAENTLDWVFWLSPEDRLVYISPSCRRITGYGAEEFLKDQKLLFKIIHPDDRPLFEDHRRFMHKAKSHGDEEFRIIRKDGKVCWISHACHAVYDDNGDYAGILSSNCDSTERKEAEAKLQSIVSQPEKTFDPSRQIQALMNAVPETFFLMDLAGHVFYANETTAHRLGCELNRLVSKDNLFDLLPPDVAEKRKQHLLEAQKSARPVRFEEEIFDRTFLTSIFPMESEDGSIFQFAVFAMDITERKASLQSALDSQRHLEENLHLLRQIVDAVPLRIFWKNRRSEYLGGNRLFALDAGRKKPEDLVGEVDQNMPWRDQAERDRKADLDVISKGEAKHEVEEERTLQNGKRIIAKTSRKPLTDVDGRIIGVLGIYDDVVPQKSTLDALSESEKRYRTLFEENPAPMMLAEPEACVVTDANPAACSFFGMSWEEIVGKKIFQVVSVSSSDVTELLNKARARRTGQIQCQQKGGDGVTRLVDIFCGTLTFAEKILLFLVIRESAEPAQTKLAAENEKPVSDIQTPVAHLPGGVDSLSILAGDLARDFNNLITVIQGHMDVAQFDLPEGHAARRSLCAAQKAVDKTRDITGRLIAFSRQSDPIVKTCHVGDLLMAQVNETLAHSQVAVAYEIPKTLWPVDIDENQIRQCIGHLAQNADEAMPEGGALHISAENIEVTAKDMLPLAEGPYVKIIFEDTGRGISAEDLPNIFDPYFTTKDKRQSIGMGLGLAIAASILKKHKGHITASSEDGAGAVFSLYLPARPDQIFQDKFNETKSPEPRRKRLLVMDESEDIRALLDMYIGQLGFEVTSVSDGQAVLSEYGAALDESNPYRAVILEASIRQGWGGTAALMKLRKINPDIKAVAILSDEDDRRVAECLEAGFQSVLTKPFRLEKIKKILEDLLEG
jgi:PAS domain S-box-containing protein